MNKNINEQVLLYAREIVALLLWDIGAVKVNLDEPFRLVCGNYSPIYINCRLAISSPNLMHIFASFTRTICERRAIPVDVVAGGETAGIPFAAYVAQSLSLPMIYVRKAKKGHGITSLIEGRIAKGSRILLVEDLITDAGSKLQFIGAIQTCGGVVEHVLVLFDRQQGGTKALETQGIRLHAVTDMTTALAVAKATRFLPLGHLESVQEYLDDLRAWHEKHGLRFKH